MTDNQLASNALGSAFAGIIARSFTHPLDTVKARLQASSQYSGVWDVFQTTMKSEGILGFYRGFSTVIVGGTPGTILYLCSYDLFKEKLLLWSVGSSSPESSLSFSQNHNTHFSIHFVSGISAEAVACLIYVPVDVIKERLQVQQLNKEHKSSHQLNKEHKRSSRNTYYKGGWDALQKIARNEGLLSGIYKGYGATLASFGPFSAFYFVFYERFKVWSQEYLDGGDAIASNSDLPFHWILFSSASAGALASWITSPLDMAKLRLQIQRGETTIASSTSTTSSLRQASSSSSSVVVTSPSSSSSSSSSYRGVLDCLKHIYRMGGSKGLFRGATARVLHFVPATTITMTCYESCRSFFQEKL